MLEKQEELEVVKQSRQSMEEDILELKSQMVEKQSSSSDTQQQVEPHVFIWKPH